MPTRRAVLIAGGATVATAAGGLAAVEEGLLPGRTRLRSALGLDGPDGVIPDVAPGPRVDGAFDSARRRARTGWSLSYPPGSGPGDALGVVVVLHGRGDDHRSAFDALGLDRYLADAVRRGAAPFAVSSVDGGESYWHERSDGTDAGAMVATEFVPLLADRGLDVSRLALLGWSMGGYGSLWLTASGALTPVAIGTMSAALWTSPDEFARGAFDDAADFAAHDVFSRRDRLAAVPLRMDCGEEDPFRDANRAFRNAMEPRPAGGIGPGLHSFGYWRRLAPDHLRFLGRRLTA